MSAVLQCLSITKVLIDRIQTMEEANREETITVIESLLAEREEWLRDIHPPFTKEEVAAGKEMLELHKELSSLLENLHRYVLRDLNAIQIKKASAAKYNQPYSHMRNDGVFYDKKQ
ncbi:hypothetical protein ACFSCZ_12295 [Siminovitchia sediminis]|uniref:Flagellar protein FliT n=1 Tax=Siminovitchia sediminis TaxID=1274353 RepID=A0ABW4KHS9_9BACI